MDKKKEFKIFLRVLALFVWGLLAIAASAGCANAAVLTAKYSLLFPAAANLAGWAYLIYKTAKKWSDEGKLSQSMQDE